MSAGVRPMERDDLPGVRSLLDRLARGGGSAPPSPVEDHLARTLLDHPWADAEMPSLVYVDGDTVVGLLATYARRMVLDGRPLRVRTAGGFVVDGRARGRGVGSALLRELLDGPQDLTLFDGANDAARRRWTATGGQTLVHASIGWRRVLRPGRAAAMSAWSLRRSAPVRRSVATLARPADAVVARVPQVRGRVRPARPSGTGQPLTPVALADLVAGCGRRMRPAYDESYLSWLFDELEPAGVVRTLVRDDTGASLGWYLYVPGERAQVLQVGACAPEHTGAVLDHLLADADTRGVAVVEGRMEPDLVDVLRTRRTTLFPTTWTLARATDPTAVALLATTDGMLSRLDGEWWVGFVLWTPPGRRS